MHGCGGGLVRVGMGPRIAETPVEDELCGYKAVYRLECISG